MSSSHTLCPCLLALVCLGCSPETASIPAQPAADLTVPDALAPNLTALANGNVLLTALRATESGHQLILSPVGDAETEPMVIAEGSDFFANWADVPGLVEAGDGSLIAHWLEESGPETYDYGIRVARSTDHGATWIELGWLNDDAWDAAEGEAIPGEHGFVSWVAEGDGARAFWLDGRGAAGHGEGHDVVGGAMQLRTTTVVDGEIAPSELLDERVCDCCPTAAVATPNGPLVAYRDRSADEIRDIHLLRRTADGWHRTVIDTSGWKIPGCPVNGPALAVEGDLVLAAWYTAHPEPRVYAAWSEDGGTTFGEPVTLTSDTLGRVSAAVLDGRGYVAWLSSTGGPVAEATIESLPPGEIRLVSLDPEGEPQATVAIASTTATRSAGLPKLVADRGRLGLAWTEVADVTAGEPSTAVSYRARRDE